MLRFAQFKQRWRLLCPADLLDPASALYQASWWHNALFNPRLPPGARILAFSPDWCRAEADPPPVL